MKRYVPILDQCGHLGSAFWLGDNSLRNQVVSNLDYKIYNLLPNILSESLQQKIAKLLISHIKELT